ncbi:MAG: nicotinamide-nucleotide amidase [Sphingobacteriales bacterium]|jgi:nicotinamide-nucleotide amidase
MVKAHIISIGDELLIGQVVNTNASWMGAKLSEIGVTITKVVSISDSEEAISNTILEGMKEADILLLTGGLGPTKDDITKKTINKLFDDKLELHQPTLDHVAQIFKKFDRPLLEVNRLQAMVPSKCEVLHNELGTAPGMLFQRDGKVIVSMPGVPYEMKFLMENGVIPFIIKSFLLPVIVHRTILTAGEGESFLAEKIEDIEDGLPSNIKLAYLPRPGSVRLRFSGTGDNKKGVETQMDEQIQKVYERIPNSIYGENEDTLMSSIFKTLVKKGQTLAVAESCTGGFLSHLITMEAGSSQVFPGGVVAYSYDIKREVLGVKQETLNKVGAVSEDCVTEMLIGVRDKFNSTYALACSGIAGPGGGTPDKPVGTVWVGLIGPNIIKVKCFSFSKNRYLNIEKTALTALEMLRRELLENN